jgi:hypothetical protein
MFGKFLKFQKLNKKYGTIPLKKVLRLPQRNDSFFKHIDGAFGIFCVHHQVELTVPPVGLQYFLLVGKVKKVPYVDHDLPFPVFIAKVGISIFFLMPSEQADPGKIFLTDNIGKKKGNQSNKSRNRTKGKELTRIRLLQWLLVSVSRRSNHC